LSIAKGGAQRQQPVFTGIVVNNFNFNFNIHRLIEGVYDSIQSRKKYMTPRAENLGACVVYTSFSKALRTWLSRQEVFARIAGVGSPRLALVRVGLGTAIRLHAPSTKRLG
jgi:hypothetical protein